MIKKRVITSFLCIAFLFACVISFIKLPQAASASGTPEKIYLALGDSLAYGYQPGAPNQSRTPGYAGDLFTTLLGAHNYASEQDMGCTGESSTTFIQGGCPGPGLIQGNKPQLQTAVEYLESHPIRPRLVTLDIGINDFLSDINTQTCQVNQSKFNTDLQTLHDNMTKTILPQLYQALTGDSQHGARLAMLNYYDPLPTLGICNQAHQDLQALNDELKGDFVSSNLGNYGVFVDINQVFKGKNMCDLTWFCLQQHTYDIHPNNQGYQLIADTIYNTLYRN